MNLISIPVWLGDFHECPYLPSERARLGWTDPEISLTPAIYTHLVQAGFRRSGSSVYRPCCGKCSACVPVRIPVAEFAPNRSQARNWERNADLAVSVGPAEFRENHYQLYRRYQAARHPRGAMASATREKYLDFLACSWGETWFIEFRRGGDVLAVSVADRLEDGLSAVYSFFDPGFPKRGLGTYTILYLVEQVRRFGLRWCYLGYWIRGSRKMSYKDTFRPIEARIGDEWSRFERGQTIKLVVRDVL